jgi:DNA-binding NarL/FixJ family response regulator
VFCTLRQPTTFRHDARHKEAHHIVSPELTASPTPTARTAPVASRGRIVLAEDDVLLREGIASLLTENGFDVAARTGHARGLRPLVREHQPDVLIVDVRMPPTHTSEGLDAALELRREDPELGVLVLSAHADVEPVMELIGDEGGAGFLLKSRVLDVDELLDAIDRIAAGRSVVDAILVRELVAARRRNDPLDELTAREREVLGLMAEGRSNAGIARRLWLAGGTVEKHVKSILSKLDIRASDDDHRRVLAVLAYLNCR